ncbi:KH domain-containing, RNA-binding, signal transduction-associated protein 2-like isoform X2 [Portunus trituberculatus]|uniref:KH domain-containing, RNA-binding, signal transduction-associated protein 2-like isoform X2 n=1 Tax=Portunus trituberculatus TaxID=210409 RepID=UPI001E1CBEDD|nr:KH domain-containing, RNA-binding, signal transduction-associated protein 2-like isoform X2 [Portunus trituberculatus]
MEELSKDVGVVALDGVEGVAGGGGGGGAILPPVPPLMAPSVDGTYLDGLMREKEALSLGSGMDLTKRLIAQEIERLQNGVRMSTKSEERKMADVTKDKAIKLTVRVLVPVRDHPKFNFVGKLLGPKGNSLKRLQEETMTKMAILGRGSMRDKQKEEELRQSGDPKFGHLSEDLHVEVTAVAPPAEAHARIAYALTEIRRYLVPDYNDEIRQGQMREMQLLVGSNTTSLTTTATTTTTTTASTNNNNINNNNNNNNGTTCGSEEESCSPHSSGSPPPPPGVGTGGGRSGGGGGGGVRGSNSLSLSSPHPALRGLNRAQAALLTAGKGELVKGRAGSGVGVGGAGHSGSNRRSVLSLLTRARAIQQKEELMDAAYHDLPGYGLYDPLADLPITDGADEVAGRVGGGGALKMTSPGERARFRHDPYPRIPSST